LEDEVMKPSAKIIALLFLVGVAKPHIASAVIVGQVDTFEDGTTQNWIINAAGMGAPPPAALPINASSGGPAGAGDAYLRLTALGGGGSGSRLTVANFAQWAGDYLAAGVSALEMDLLNLGTTDLSLRLMIADPIPGPPTNIAFSTIAVSLPTGTGWTHVVLPIAPSDLTAGLGSVEEALRNATELRLYHSPALNFPNPVLPIEAIVAQLGVDNIRANAQPVPEFGSAGLVAASLIAFIVGARSPWAWSGAA
jgi:hypothetical protein